MERSSALSPKLICKHWVKPECASLPQSCLLCSRFRKLAPFYHSPTCPGTSRVLRLIALIAICVGCMLSITTPTGRIASNDEHAARTPIVCTSGHARCYASTNFPETVGTKSKLMFVAAPHRDVSRHGATQLQMHKPHIYELHMLLVFCSFHRAYSRARTYL
jgi:hypothetical protein